MRTALAILMSLFVTACQPDTPFDAAPATNAPSVKIILKKDNFGSGTHIGNGIVLTAAHVVGTETAVMVKFADGQIAEGQVLWTAKPFDIALIHYKDSGQASAAHLTCRDLADGEPIIAKGNPQDQDNLTMRGFVAGEARPYGPWAMVTPTDLTLINGMSGGGIFDAHGDLVGVTVGTMVLRISMFPTWARVGYVVPGRTVCDMLARA